MGHEGVCKVHNMQMCRAYLFQPIAAACLKMVGTMNCSGDLFLPVCVHMYSWDKVFLVH